jgi:hypothetical protein
MAQPSYAATPAQGYVPVSEHDMEEESRLADGLASMQEQLTNLNYNIEEMNDTSKQMEQLNMEQGYNVLDPANSQTPAVGISKPASKAVSTADAPVSESKSADIPRVPQLDPAHTKKTNGYLSKKGGSDGGRRNWKKRWFFLKHELTQPGETFQLYYYANEGDDRPKGAIDLTDAEITITEKAKQHKNKSAANNFEFQIMVGGGSNPRVYEIFADQEAERADWVETLQHVVATARNHRQLLIAAHKSDSARRKVRSAEDAALNCEAFGAARFAAKAGIRNEFTIQASDEFGVPRQTGGLENHLKATLTNDDLYYDLEIYDTQNQDGTYSVSYSTCRAGQYQLDVTLDGHPISGSPSQVTVSAGEPFPGACQAQGEGVHSAQTENTNYFSITARDYFENECCEGGAQFTVAISGPAILQGFQDSGNGKYSAAYKVQHGHNGEIVEISLTLASRSGAPVHLPGSPFNITIDDPAVAEPEPVLVLAPAAPQEELDETLEVNAGQDSPNFAEPDDDAEPLQSTAVEAAEPAPPLEPVRTIAEAPSEQVAPAAAAPAAAPAMAYLLGESGSAPVDNTAQALKQKQQDIDAEYERLSALRRNLELKKTQRGSPAIAGASSPAAANAPGSRLAAMSAAAASRRSPAAAGGTARRQASGPFAADVMSLFQQHNAQLTNVFKFYAGNGNSMLTWQAVLALGQDFDIIPTFMTRKEMKAVYSGVAGAKVGVDFGGFVEAMGNCVLEALSKPAFAHLYPTDAAKVTVLLETWGLADAQKLRNVRR